MKVFISWSGEASKNIAEIFRQWLPSVIQVVKPYYSPDDIAKGTRWSSEIAKELDESKIGIICLTKDNLSSAWIMFEAGALSKNIDQSKVCPILFGVEPSDIQGPLVQFQAARFTKTEVKKVVRMMNEELGDSQLASEVFESVFEMWWPRLDENITAELKRAKNQIVEEIRSERDLLEEVLSLSRTMVMERERRGDRGISPAAIDDLLSTLKAIISVVIEEDNLSLSTMLLDLRAPIKHFIRYAGLDVNRKAELDSVFEDIYRRLKAYANENNNFEEFRDREPTNRKRDSSK